MKLMAKLIFISLLAVVVASCGGRKKLQENPGVAMGSDASSGDVMNRISADVQRRLEQLGISPSERYNWSNPLSNRTIYFEYDSTSLDAESQLIVEYHGQQLLTTGGTVVLEGHADERGTREYNLALGENRAQVVNSVLSAYGVKNTQVVSYGEEKPVSNELWKNRRVELIY